MPDRANRARRRNAGSRGSSRPRARTSFPSIVELASDGVATNDKSRIAAHMLAGRDLPGGWHVVTKIERPPDASGGQFSVGYMVERHGVRGYLKALDYSRAFQSDNSTQVLEWMTSAYNFEANLLSGCAHMDRVVRALDRGEIVVDGAEGVPNVAYLIFEEAEGDIRAALDSLSASFDYAWACRMLHHAATGLWQMHQADMAHQDVKPSNILTFGRGLSKLADLGRASQRGAVAPHDDFPCAGDHTYAPPELLYGFVAPEWQVRRQACDLYLLGSLTMFVFSGATMTAALMTFLDDAQLPGAWSDGYDALLPFIRVAFDRALDEFEQTMPEELAQEIVPLVQALCDPDPAVRGHPSARLRRGNPYSLERFVSAFDLVARRAEIGAYQDLK